MEPALSAMAHGRDADQDKALRIAQAALAASVGLDAERSTLYFDLTMASLGEAAREVLKRMNPAKYDCQSEFDGEVSRVRAATVVDLDRFAERLLTAASAEEVLDAG